MPLKCLDDIDEATKYITQLTQRACCFNTPTSKATDQCSNYLERYLYTLYIDEPTKLRPTGPCPWSEFSNITTTSPNSTPGLESKF